LECNGEEEGGSEMDFGFIVTTIIGAVALGFVGGALVMRNNYKHFKIGEADVKRLILDAKMTAEQKLLHIRNKLGV
jgi:hypothetical protein